MKSNKKNKNNNRKKGINPSGLNVIATFLGTVCVGMFLMFFTSEVISLFMISVFIFFLLWLIVAVAFMDQRPLGRCEQTIGLLRDRHFKQAYQKITNLVLNWFWTRLCDEVPSNAGGWMTFRAALTARLYDRALLIAVVYPMLLVLLFWLLTREAGVLGSVVVLPSATLWQRTLVLFSIVLTFAGPYWILKSLSGERLRKLLESSRRFALIGSAVVAVVAVLVVFAFAGAVAGAFAGAVVFAFAGAVAVVGAFAGVVAGAGAGAVAFTFAVAVAFVFAGAVALAVAGAVAAAAAGAFAFAGAVAVATAFVFVFVGAVMTVVKKKLGLALVFATLWVVLVWCVWALGVDWGTLAATSIKGYQQLYTVFLFLTILPLINAVFDTLSYAATLTSTHLGLRQRNPLFMGLLDFVVALLLFLGLGAALILVLHGLNSLAQSSWGYGTPIFDLPATLDRIWAAPTENLWVFFMLFSTALPTLVHLCLALVGAQTLVPYCVRQWVISRIEKTEQGDTVAAPLVTLFTAMVFMVPFAVALVVIWALWHWGQDIFIWLLSYYGDALLWLAGAAGV